MNKSLFIIAGLIILFSSCKTSQKAVTLDTAKQLNYKPLNFSFLETRSTIKIENPGLNLTGKAIIRMKQDEVIWGSMRVFMVEGARFIITPDSIKTLIPMQKRYEAVSFDSVEKVMGVPITFDWLQSIMLAEIPENILSSTESIEQKSDTTILTKTENRLKTKALYEKNYKKIIQIYAEDKITASFMSINYEEFKQFDKSLVPVLTVISILQKDAESEESKESKVTITTDSYKFQKEPLNFPFKTPSWANE